MYKYVLCLHKHAMIVVLRTCRAFLPAAMVFCILFVCATTSFCLARCCAANERLVNINNSMSKNKPELDYCCVVLLLKMWVVNYAHLQ